MAPQHDNESGRTHFSSARATMVRETGKVENYHSAVYSSVAVYTDDRKTTDMLIARWPEIMGELDTIIQQLIENQDDDDN